MSTFCRECGHALEQRLAFGKTRGVCPACGYTHFEDPKVAVGVVVEMDGGIVLGRRNHEPKMGCWSFPSGFVDAGEVPEDAAAREVEEETGVLVQLDRLLGVYSKPGERVIFIAFAGHAVGGALEAGEECIEVAVFPPDRLPELAFPNDGAILAAWSSGRGLPVQHSPRGAS
ncbi:MAG TPA: NUDIX hydrolase [Dehalococcoidia bacterium]|jgi:ADP-ribose pyrophosphatase YjhB (NUDIX family)|nr:NUDIX hydrolase [Dehalococcoidia bacterium]